MEEQKKWVIIGVLLVILILIGAGGVYWYYYKTRQASQALEKPKAEEAPPPSPAEAKPGEPLTAEPAVKLPPLDQSDDFARQMLKGLSPHGKISDWLKSKNIIRVMTAAMDNIAAGKSPRAHLGFLFQGLVFPVSEKGDKIYLDPKGYDRYDLLADGFVSLNTGRTVQAYEKAKPLFQDAYRELGYPQKDFQATLIQAIQKVLETPTVETEVLLKEEGKGVNYLYVDNALEELNEVQKHMLRMGPKNTRKIQQKLWEIALALGVPENQLPKPKAYASKMK